MSNIYDRVCGGALWKLLAACGYSAAEEECVKARFPAYVKRLGGEENGCVRVALEASGLSTTLLLPLSVLWDSWLPLLLLLEKRLNVVQAARLLVGLVGPAGSGKTTTSELLAALARAWLADGFKSVVCLSMDAYHLRNAELEARGLRSQKGRADTISVCDFAADLARLRAPPENATVTLPAYDRAVTHEPVSDAVVVAPTARLVLVEGLYLCRSTDGTRSPPLPAADEAAWAAVRSALDLTIFIDTPLPVCRARVVARKVAGGVSLDDAMMHYDRVDAPTFSMLREVDARQPGRASLDSHHVQAATGSGPDLTLFLGGGGDGTAQFIAAAEWWERSAEDISLQSAPTPIAADTAATAAPLTFFVLGLNPCVQRTLIFEGRSWARGRVNRADASAVSVGGKGQHAALALVRASVDAATSASETKGADEAVHLLQFCAGARGEEVCTLLAAGAAAAGGTIGSEVARGGRGHLHVHTHKGAQGSQTRTCTTLIDDVDGDSTELVEPSAPVPAASAAALVDEARAMLANARAAGGRLALAVMGTAPPGAGGIAEALLRAEAAESPARRALVLADVSSAGGQLLASGALTVLKVNTTELAALAAELGGDACEPADIVRCAARAFSAGGAVLRTIAVTNGSRPAHLFQRCDGGAGGGGEVAHWELSVPAVAPVRNAIGSGDVVAAVLLRQLLVGASPLAGFIAALAAASASCATLTGAVWESTAALEASRGVKILRAARVFLPAAS